MNNSWIAQDGHARSQSTCKSNLNSTDKNYQVLGEDNLGAKFLKFAEGVGETNSVKQKLDNALTFSLSLL